IRGPQVQQRPTILIKRFSVSDDPHRASCRQHGAQVVASFRAETFPELTYFGGVEADEANFDLIVSGCRTIRLQVESVAVVHVRDVGESRVRGSRDRGNRRTLCSLTASSTGRK